VKVINLKQRTPEWYQWRKEGIGASDIPVLTGNSPYTNKRQLLLQKKGVGKPTFVSEHVIKISNKVEEDAIIYFKEKKEIIFMGPPSEVMSVLTNKANAKAWCDSILNIFYINAY
jgi:putative phage-type endonuclease